MDYLNDEHYQSFLFDIVMKNDSTVTISGNKRFEQGFQTGILNAKFINEHNVHDILVRDKSQELLGDVIVHGDVFVEGDVQTNTLNDFSIPFLNSIYKQNGEQLIIEGSFYLKSLCNFTHRFFLGNVDFGDGVEIDHLYVNGLVNDLDLLNYFDSLVRINNDIKLPGSVFFNNVVRKFRTTDQPLKMIFF